MFFELIKFFNRRRKNSFRSRIKEVLTKSPQDVPALNVMLSGDPIATLFYDEKEEKYGLIYHEKYHDYKGLLPFNVDLPENTLIQIGKPYYSQELWYPFSARIPSKSRADCIEKLKEYDLTLNDHPLKILDCIGRVSIANHWKLEPVYS